MASIVDELLLEQLPKIIARHEALEAAGVQTQSHKDIDVLLRIIADYEGYIAAQSAIKKSIKPAKQPKPQKIQPIKADRCEMDDWLKPVYNHIIEQTKLGKRVYRGFFSRFDLRAVTVLLYRGDIVKQWDENHELCYLVPAQTAG